MAVSPTYDDKIALMLGHLMLQLARLELQVQTLTERIAVLEDPPDTHQPPVEPA